MTQGEIESLTIAMEKAASRLEMDIMKDIVRRIKANEGLTSTAEYQIDRLRQMGLADDYIKKEIQTYLKVSDDEMDRIFRNVPENEYGKYSSMYQDMGIDQKPFGNHVTIQSVIDSSLRQTAGTFQNISQTLGFAVQNGGKTEFLPVAEYYQKALDNAILGVATGAFDYNSALLRVVKEMTRSGLRTVGYASGRSYRIESASRMALMTGFSQITGHMNQQIASELGTDDYEVSYHMGARPTHQWWQGRVYSYQDLIYTCGLGTVTGLCGINCYHWYEPFIRGVSVRNYTDQELDAMIQEENRPRSYRGREYTTYTALQKQRKMELQMRAQRQEIALLKEGGGSTLDILAAQARYRTIMNEYVSFSKAMNMPQQMERVYMDGLGRSVKKSVAKKSLFGTIEARLSKEEKAVTTIRSLGKVKKEVIEKEFGKIQTDEIIITNEREEHIKSRHPEDYELFQKYGAETVSSPDLMIRDGKNKGTVFMIKRLHGTNLNVVVRVALERDEKGLKNSVMTFYRLRERNLRKMIEKNSILIGKDSVLYKRE
ncbi:phage minor capsid protein [Massilistercora timonensis]|uniref:phage minor capsid protein n=1 Tax=Massilistercora timonensis TaxID=2086584 RepID=UPI003AB45C8E